jgi:hypothetical protein
MGLKSDKKTKTDRTGGNEPSSSMSMSIGIG